MSVIRLESRHMMAKWAELLPFRLLENMGYAEFRILYAMSSLQVTISSCACGEQRGSSLKWIKNLQAEIMELDTHYIRTHPE